MAKDQKNERNCEIKQQHSRKDVDNIYAQRVEQFYCCVASFPRFLLASLVVLWSLSQVVFNSLRPDRAKFARRFPT